MNITKQSVSHTQNYPLFFSLGTNIAQSINDPDQYAGPVLRSRPFILYSESLFQYDTLFSEILFSNKLNQSKRISFYSSEDVFESFNDIEPILLSDRDFFLYEKPLLELKDKIYNVYSEHQEENWDGYGAEPIKYLSQSLLFAKDLFFESISLVESVDIIPENDGCLCFEWFKSDNKFISISVESNQFIYNYKLGDEKGCGEVSFSGKQMLIEQIKKII